MQLEKKEWWAGILFSPVKDKGQRLLHETLKAVSTEFSRALHTLHWPGKSMPGWNNDVTKVFTLNHEALRKEPHFSNSLTAPSSRRFIAG